MSQYTIKLWSVDSIKAPGKENARSAYTATLQWSNKSDQANQGNSVRDSKFKITLPGEGRTEEIPLKGTFWTYNGQDPTIEHPYNVTLAAEDDDLYVYLSFILSFKKVTGESGGSRYVKRWGIAGQAVFEDKKADNPKREVYYLTGIKRAIGSEEDNS